MTSFTAKSSPPQSNRNIVFVVYPGIKLLDLAGPLQAFVDAVDDRGNAVYRTAVTSIDGAFTASDTPVSLSTESLSLWQRQKIDTLIVVGGNGVFLAKDDTRLLACVKRLATRSRRVGSICNGAFVLAACGLLNGRRAVTHWESCEKLATAYPAIEVEADPIFLNDGNVWTSAGVTAGIDMAIAMITEDLGRSAALRLARSLVTYFVRPGGQSQFSEALDLQTADGAGRFDKMHEWMQNNLKQDLRIERLAAKARMSPRNFARTYLSHTGRTPAKAVEAMRVEAARRMLEDEHISVKVIAARCGFGDDERMRRSFLRILSVSPQVYRSRF